MSCRGVNGKINSKFADDLGMFSVDSMCVLTVNQRILTG